MKSRFVIPVLLFCLGSCNTNTSKLQKYFNSKKSFHDSTAFKLKALSKKLDADISIHVRYDLDSSIIVRLHFRALGKAIPIEIDRFGKRTDDFPELTQDFEMPIGIIEDIRKAIYPSIMADSNKVFFGSEFIGTSERRYGILYFTDENKIIKADIVKYISNNICIYKDIIP